MPPHGTPAPRSAVKRKLLCYKRSTRSSYVRPPYAYGRRRPLQGEDGMAAKFEIFDDKGGKYHFHLKAPNGESRSSSPVRLTRRRRMPTKGLTRSRSMHPTPRWKTSRDKQDQAKSSGCESTPRSSSSASPRQLDGLLDERLRF